MIAECLEQKRAFGMVRVKENTLSPVGCSATILNVTKKYEDGRLDIEAEGRQRFEIVQLNQQRSFLQGEVTFFDDEPSAVDNAEKQTALELHEQLFAILGQNVEVEADVPTLSFLLASELPVDLDFKQAILEMPSEAQRLRTLLDYYHKVLPKLKSIVAGRVKSGGEGYLN